MNLFETGSKIFVIHSPLPDDLPLSQAHDSGSRSVYMTEKMDIVYRNQCSNSLADSCIQKSESTCSPHRIQMVCRFIE